MHSPYRQTIGAQLFLWVHFDPQYLHCRYSSLEEPVASHIWGMLKEWPGGGTSTKLCFDDLPKLPAEQVYKIADWLSDKVGLIASGHAHILLESDLALKVGGSLT